MIFVPMQRNQLKPWIPNDYSVLCMWKIWSCLFILSQFSGLLHLYICASLHLLVFEVCIEHVYRLWTFCNRLNFPALNLSLSHWFQSSFKLVEGSCVTAPIVLWKPLSVNQTKDVIRNWFKCLCKWASVTSQPVINIWPLKHHYMVLF